MRVWMLQDAITGLVHCITQISDPWLSLPSERKEGRKEGKNKQKKRREKDA
jgi:hypothetical protein